MLPRKCVTSEPFFFLFFPIFSCFSFFFFYILFFLVFFFSLFSFFVLIFFLSFFYNSFFSFFFNNYFLIIFSSSSENSLPDPWKTLCPCPIPAGSQAAGPPTERTRERKKGMAKRASGKGGEFISSPLSLPPSSPPPPFPPSTPSFHPPPPLSAYQSMVGRSYDRVV